MQTPAEKIADQLLFRKQVNVSRARLQEACELIVFRLSIGKNFTEEICIFLCDFFNKQNNFDLCLFVSDAWQRANIISPDVTKHRAQALINSGQLDAADYALKNVLSSLSPLMPKQNKELQGLLCRVAKQRYVLNPSPQALNHAIQLYLRLFDHVEFCDPCWHGINALALIHLAYIQSVENPAIARQRELIDTVKKSAIENIKSNKDDIWSFATLAEVYLAEHELEVEFADIDRLTKLKDQVELWLYRLIDHSVLTPFVLGSLERQLKEIWHANAYDQNEGLPSLMAGVIARFNDRSADFRSFSKDELSTLKRQASVVGALEKSFSNTRFFTPDSVKKLLECCKSVGCVVDQNGARLGTGFLVEAKDINPVWEKGLVFMTNSHVVSADGANRALQVDEAYIVFDEDSTKTKYAIERLLFSSLPGQEGEVRLTNDMLDVSILTLKSLPMGAIGLTIASRMPKVTGETKAFVIGHPNGSGLQISLHDAAILAIDPIGRLIHYRTPTEPGNSGSPVFNSYWQLIAIHHAGSTQMPRFKTEPPPEFYEANEGVCISAIKIAASL